MPQRVLVTGERARGVALVVAGVITAQFGAGYAVTLFDELGPAGAAFLRLCFAALVLVAAWRPRLRGHTFADLRLAVTFGVVLGVMNFSIYSAMDRIPLGVAVTIEFAGPLAVAVIGRGARSTCCGSRSPRPGSCCSSIRAAARWTRSASCSRSLAAALWAFYILLARADWRGFPRRIGLAVAMVVGAWCSPFGIGQAGRELLKPELLRLAPRSRWPRR